MIWGEYIKIALDSIRRARFRSFLTMLGIVIAVVSVVTAVSLGEGIKHQVKGQTNAVGGDLITVRPGNLVRRDDKGKINGVNILSFLTSSRITDKDVESISKNPKVELAVPFSFVTGNPSLGQDKYEQGFIMATTDDMPKVVKQKLEFGDFFDAGNSGNHRAVIGFNVAERLFKENVPLGKTFQLRGQDFVVSGVLERFPVNPLNPEIDFNNGVFIPYQTGVEIANSDLQPYEVLVRPKNKQPAEVAATIKSISDDLRRNHQQQNDFTVLRQDEMVTVADSVFTSVNRSIVLLVAVVLFVGGVGIMNVMLVAVTERTREIGIRKTVGATNRQIQTQFLVEAGVISALGAIFGLILSGIVNFLLRIFTNLEPIINLKTVLLSAVIAVLVGVVFGMIPAIKASLKDPIEALRSY